MALWLGGEECLVLLGSSDRLIYTVWELLVVGLIYIFPAKSTVSIIILTSFDSVTKQTREA